MNRLHHTFAAFVSRDFRLLWSGSLLSVTAFMTSFYLIPAVGYALTDSYLMASIAAMGSGISQVLLGPFGGVIADRYPKKPLVLAGQIAPGLIIAGVGVLIVTGAITIPLLVGATLLMGMAFSVMGPARQAWVGELMPGNLLANAVALQQLAMNIAQVTTPVLIIGALGQVLGEGELFLAVASLFVIVIPLTTMIRRTEPAERTGPQRAVLTELREGVRYMISNPRLRILWAYFLIMVMCGFAFQTLLSGMLSEEFGRSPFALTLPLLALGVPSMFINMGLAGLVSGRFAWPALLSMGALMAVGFWMTAWAPTYGAFLATAGLIGAGRSGVMLVNQSIMMSNTRPQYFGRVMSLVMMGFGFQSLLAPIWGAIADTVGGRQTLAVIGVVALAATALMVLGWLRTRNLPTEQGTAADDAPTETAPAEPLPPQLPPAPIPAFAARVAPVALMDGQKAGSLGAGG